MNLTVQEAEIYKAVSNFGQAITSSGIAELVSIDRKKIAGMVQRICDKGAFARVKKGWYEAKEVTFTVGLTPAEARSPIVIDTNVPAGIRQFIITEATKKPPLKRMLIASKAGVSKLVLNQILIEEGLDLEAK
jgi:hypothetical protein